MKGVVGLVGTLSSGKGTAAKLLHDKGFSYVSLSDILRLVARPLGLTHEREPLILLGNTLRNHFGEDILARGAFKKIEGSSSDVVIDSIRHPAEIKFLKDHTEAFIVGITTSPERAWKFLQGRKRPGDPETFEEFFVAYKKDFGIGQEKHGLQVGNSLKYADKVIHNEGTIEQLESTIQWAIENHFGSIEGGRKPERV